ncbi:hypothetical protein B0O80DRAFT_463970 [Mortierella sp. GBAus27b]|nr:hypothetical protein BGX31_005228 [Mortierella sp. GBA43]KAI8347901.1 hypothetical protein B0O80DRAFT_463970 [Mortierella sp. GBAus27b]
MTGEPLIQLSARDISLGSLCRLTDALIIEGVLMHLAAKDLCSLALTSRFLHVFSRNDVLWRRLYFKERDRKSTRLVFRGTWLLTYLFPTPEQDDACAKHPLVTHPVHLQGVYSEYLHTQWLRSNTFFGHFYPPPPLPPPEATGIRQVPDLSIPVEDYQSMDLDAFYKRYAYPSRPVMFQNSGVETWPAWKQWTLEALVEKYGDVPFRVSNIDSNIDPTIDLCFKDFLHYVRYNRDQDPLYLFDHRFADTIPEMKSAYEVPKYFEVDFFSLLKGSARPPYRWILIGPQRTGAPWHIDPSGTSAWNTLLSGHKRWALYPPHMVPPGHNPLSSRRLTSVEWYLDVYPTLPPEVKPLEIVQCPGQTIFVPAGWWHMVLNMDDTVAVTQNFVDETNLTLVKHSLLTDGTESSQTRRWEILEKELPKLRPELGPAIRLSPEEQLLNSFKQQESWLDPESSDSTVKWEERVRDVLKRSTGTANPGRIIPIKSGKNVCFLSDVGFVKFFTPVNDGHGSFLSEIESNLILMATSEERTHSQVLSFPKMLGHGYLLDTDQVAPSHWRWPYIVTENKQCRANDHLLFGSALDYYESEEDDGYQKLLPLLTRTLQYLHTLDTSKVLDIQKNRDQHHEHKDQAMHITQRLATAVENHARWRIFPKHLLELLANYLPANGAQVFDPSNGDATASIVHGDVSLGNILGYRNDTSCQDMTEVEDGTEVSSSASLPSSGSGRSSPNIDESSTQPDDDQCAFTPTTLIDFGDSICFGDPLIDLVSVFIAILNCQRDKELTDHLLDYWRNWTSAKGQSNTRTSLARRCMWHVLLWPSEGLSLHFVRSISGIGEMTTWEQVEEAAFGWCSMLQ